MLLIVLLPQAGEGARRADEGVVGEKTSSFAAPIVDMSLWGGFTAMVLAIANRGRTAPTVLIERYYYQNTSTHHTLNPAPLPLAGEGF